MKKTILKIAFFILSIAPLSSCSSSDDGTQNPDPDPINNENTWKLDMYNYSRRVSMQTYVTSGNFTVVNIDSNVSTANAPYTNCNLIITFNTNATGNYTVKTQNTMFTNGTLNYMHIRCQIASGNGTGAVYDSSDSNVTATVTQVNGKFVVNIPNNVVLTRTSNDGMVNPPNTFNLTAQKVR